MHTHYSRNHQCHLPARCIVPQVHASVIFILDFIGIEKLFGEAGPVANVVRTATPFKVRPCVAMCRLAITAAVVQLALGAGPSDAEHDAR